ncbi:hypothetical protein ABT084_22590 [Streptomyces sp. NPDC002138]|uniref:hypothetical protein n=1 Tax=Streptomyces sp. NPDC002138 TaxID=3154410 RepID=UPI00332E8498
MNRRPVQVQGPAIHLAAAVSAQRIPGLISASFIGSQIRLEVPEAEFSIWVGAHGPAGLALRVEAVFRELGQDRGAGGTWWNAWDLTVESPAPAPGAEAAGAEAACEDFRPRDTPGAPGPDAPGADTPRAGARAPALVPGAGAVGPGHPRARRCVPAERTARALAGEIAVARRKFADLLAEAREQGRVAA